MALHRTDTAALLCGLWLLVFAALSINSASQAALLADPQELLSCGLTRSRLAAEGTLQLPRRADSALLRELLSWSDPMVPPIHDAACNGDAETLRRLLAEGVSPDALDDANEERFSARTPLHYLCLRGNGGGDRVACFELLRDAGANLELPDHIQYTPLAYAANSWSVELVSLLVQSGVNVNATNNGGATALHMAARGASADCVEILLAAGAGLDARTISGRSPFDMALRNRRHRAWPLFLRAGAELPAAGSYHPDPYLERVVAAGGFQ